MSGRRIKQWLLVLLAGLLSASLLPAQNTSGTIVGTVVDSAGSVIPGASILIENTDTHVTRSAVTDARGDYTETLLNPGHYSVTVKSPGFKASISQGLVLDVEQVLRVNVTLSPGAATESVTVNAEQVALDTDSATVGTVLSEDQITDMPLNGRQFTDLLFLTPGAVASSGEQGQYRFSEGNAISLGGGNSDSQGYTVDGTTILDTSYDTPMYEPSLDSIEELKVQTKTYSAEYGFSANQVNLVTKSGTNQYHGSVFEFLRNNALDALTYQFNFPKIPNTPFKQNQFGYSLGGPVWIPHVYKGKDKTFFFANYEGERISQANVQSGTVPTAAELGGTVFVPTGNNPCTGKPFNTVPIIDPTTGNAFPSDGNGNYIIPTSRFSRLAKLVTTPGLYWPAPNETPTCSSTNNYSANVPTTTDVDQQTYRIDHTFGPSDSIFGRVTKFDANNTGGSLTPIGDQIIVETVRFYQLTETHTFTPNLLNQARIAFIESQGNRIPYTIPQSAVSALGFTGTFNLKESGYTEIGFGNTGPDTFQGPNDGSGYNGGGAAANLPNNQTQPTWDLGDSLSWTHGKQTIAAGYEFRHWNLDLLNTSNPYGNFSFSGTFTNSPYADMLLGYVGQVSVDQPGPLANPQVGSAPHLQFVAWAPYFEDDIKLTPKLTVDLGLRYDFSGTATEKQNDFAWLDTSLPGGGVYWANKSIVQTYGNGLYVYGGRSNGPAPKNVWAPRVGFSYRPFDKTVVRGGYGMFYDSSESNEYEASTAFYPLGPTSQYTSYPAAGVVYKSDNLFPNFTTSGPVTTAQLSFLQIAATKKLDPYIADWSFGVERDIYRNTILDIDYVGNKGTHLNIRSNPNQPTECVLVQAAGNGCESTVTQRQPYQNLGFLVYEGWNGYSNYNAMNVKLEHRGTDFSVLVGYTWSKSMDVKSAAASVGADIAGWSAPQDSYDIGADYARSDYDTGQRIVVSSRYKLPIGRGRAIFGGANHLEDALIGGWQVNGIGVANGGFPFSIAANDTNFVNQSYDERANIVGVPYPSGFHKSTHEWFNTAAFAQPEEGAFGSSSRNIIRAPGVANIDFSLFKDFRVGERFKAQFRYESFNFLNHPQFAGPDEGVDDGNFGQINGTNNSGRETQFALKILF
jgi:hypothetical protein